MIKPTKYLDLDTCVVAVAAEVLAVLRRNQVMPYAELLASVQSSLSEGVRFTFPLSLDLLYLLGRIEYDDDTDALLLVDHQADQAGRRR